MGKLQLDENLALGEYRELTDEESKNDRRKRLNLILNLNIANLDNKGFDIKTKI